MNYTIYSYRFAQEIIEHPNFHPAQNEITRIIRNCPLFFWPNKSAKNNRLDVVQQLQNAYYDVFFHSHNNWNYHPDATRIPNSKLKADFSKSFNGLKLHVEVQFGNMSRWYSDIFKFQTAYSQNMIDMGICIVPTLNLARRIDSNVTNYERCVRELPSADLSITLPILLIGVEPDARTQQIDVSQSAFNVINDLTGRGNSDNLYRVIDGHIRGANIANIGSHSPIGNRP